MEETWNSNDEEDYGIKNPNDLVSDKPKEQVGGWSYAYSDVKWDWAKELQQQVDKEIMNYIKINYGVKQ